MYQSSFFASRKAPQQQAKTIEQQPNFVKASAAESNEQRKAKIDFDRLWDLSV